MQYIPTWEHDLSTLPGLTKAEIKFVSQQYRNGPHLYYMYLHYRENEYFISSQIAPQLLLYHKFTNSISKIASINLYRRYFLYLYLDDLIPINPKMDINIHIKHTHDLEWLYITQKYNKSKQL